ncbi:pyridoxal phosphate-dependent aminotransferase [Bifidobacterium gallicum]|uniref:alanine transaminase n=1 Tax=Bifidobacterium gallicum DSM 20093 = LMG 11596 TaxID=561180 RepID=D1NU18_9BIFI|nr:pyridoxal phosphate-dependent aminotransferase [Bifidobacterium gallicum]EFA23222.1 aminotransferase, class I/II [Bifidobacterium gallicum DSM 20093 = LMG 11596]KFI58884.1 aminotransferase [Bifidobacterium gallicum DSM 20093 = LMG 11596]
MRFSSRVNTTAPNPIALAEAQARAAGIALHKLNDSNPTAHGLAPHSLNAVYHAEPRGQYDAREVLAAFLNARAEQETREGRAHCQSQPHQVTADRLYLLSSTSQAYAWLMKLLCDAGDAVLGPKPGYPLIESIAGLECVHSIEYQLAFDGSWTVDVPAMRAAIETFNTEHAPHRVQAIIVINPNNPSGSYVKPAEREAIIDLARAMDCAIIADEVFYGYDLEPFDGNQRFAGENAVLTFALDGFSKMLAAPHAKVGWIEVSGPHTDVSEAMRRLDVIADDFLPMSELIAQAMPAMLEEASAQTATVRERTQSNLRRLHALLDADELGVTQVLRAEGGWNVLLRMPSVIDENECVLAMIRDQHTTGQPGYFFDMPANGYLALSLLPEPAQFERNVHTVLNAVRAALAD